ncbi:MAG: C40 family peptidase, partial [Bacteroidales bacterium]
KQMKIIFSNKSEHTRASKKVLKTIVLFLLVPIGIIIMLSITSNWVPYQKSNTIDTTAIIGYTYFKSHGVNFDPGSSVDLYNALYTTVGIPHSSKAGRRGLDCSGLVKKIYNENFNANLKGGSRDLHRISKPVKRERMKEGDLVFFKIGTNRVNHVGIYLNNNKFMHSSVENGVSINDLTEPYYARNFFAAGRIEELNF